MTPADLVAPAGDAGSPEIRPVKPPGVRGEEPIVFDCEGERLLGSLHRPQAGLCDAESQTGVVVIVGGPQYRAGSHRQFVHLARTLARTGYPVLRFDQRGMGDSSGEQRNLMHITPDIGAAVDALQRQAPAVQNVVLWGLCGGASAALLYLHDRPDPRIRGLCLVNPWVRSADTEARTQLRHYYTRRLLQREFWAKLLRGGIGVRAARELAGSVATARRATPAAEDNYRDRMLRGWKAFTGRTLVILSEEDFTAREFADFVAAQPPWRTRAARTDVTHENLVGADHTCSSATHRAALESATSRWLAMLDAEGRRG